MASLSEADITASECKDLPNEYSASRYCVALAAPCKTALSPSTSTGPLTSAAFGHVRVPPMVPKGTSV